MILEKFIEHHQLFEFVELFRVYMKEEITSKSEDNSENSRKLPLIPGTGMNFMHMAVVHNTYQILAYMVIEL